MPGASLSFNDAEFQKKLEQYLSLTKKSLPVALNKIAADVMFRAAQSAPKADKEKINALATLWQNGDKRWVKFITNVLKAKYGKAAKTKRGNIVVGRRRNKKGAWVDRSKSYQTLARDISRALLGRRRAAIGFIKSSFVKAAYGVQGKPAPQRDYDGKDGAQGWAKAASEAQGDRLAAELFIAFVYKKKIASKAGAVNIAHAAMRDAVAYKTQDLEIYIRDKLDEAARKARLKKQR